MSFTKIAFKAVSGYIKLLRIPFDLAARATGRSGLEVDEAEGRVRETVGAVVGDERMQAEGRRRQAATAQRSRAQALRDDAATRERAAGASAAKARENLSELENRERLEQLREESDALKERRAAKEAEKDSERLSDAAAAVKAARKEARSY